MYVLPAISMVIGYQGHQLGVLLLFALSWAALCCMQVCKVYIGSFNADKPIRTDMNPSGEELFNKEPADLLQDLFEIPQRSCDRKV